MPAPSSGRPGLGRFQQEFQSGGLIVDTGYNTPMVLGASGGRQQQFTLHPRPPILDALELPPLQCPREVVR